MTASITPWSGTWIDVTGPLGTNDDLVHAIVNRRGCTPETLQEELASMDDHVTVDATYSSVCK